MRSAWFAWLTLLGIALTVAGLLLIDRYPWAGWLFAVGLFASVGTAALYARLLMRRAGGEA